ncbi:MAG: hypothetical protein ABSG31_02845 [Tepidisphaeraceae bacterium]|jgi:hypothetical protein
MKNKPTNRTRRNKVKATPDECDFARLDIWARKLTLRAGRPLDASERREEKLARSVGRPIKPVIVGKQNKIKN